MGMGIASGSFCRVPILQTIHLSGHGEHPMLPETFITLGINVLVWHQTQTNCKVPSPAPNLQRVPWIQVDNFKDKTFHLVYELCMHIVLQKCFILLFVHAQQANAKIYAYNTREGKIFTYPRQERIIVFKIIVICVFNMFIQPVFNDMFTYTICCIVLTHSQNIHVSCFNIIGIISTNRNYYQPYSC